MSVSLTCVSQLGGKDGTASLRASVQKDTTDSPFRNGFNCLLNGSGYVT